MPQGDDFDRELSGTIGTQVGIGVLFVLLWLLGVGINDRSHSSAGHVIGVVMAVLFFILALVSFRFAYKANSARRVYRERN